MAVTSVAQGRTVGVTIGDWFKYSDIKVNWSSNDPNATSPPLRHLWLKEMNETEWFLLSIENVSGAEISFQTVKHFRDRSEKTEDGSVSINTGTGHAPSIMIGISIAIAANLSVNDSIYISPHFSAWKINNTVIRTYADGERETNHLNMTWESILAINNTQYEPYHSLGNSNFYWDRATGILVEYSFQEIEQLGEYLITSSLSYRIIESNVWVVLKLPTWTPTLLIVAVITASILIFSWLIKIRIKHRKLDRRK
jgi:hypothetical protein